MTGYKRWREDRNAWELVVPLPRSSATGRRRSRSQIFRGTEREADRALAHLVVASEVEHVASDATVEQLLHRWMAMVEADLSPTTVREYRRLIDRRIVPAIGQVPILELGPERLDGFYRELVVGGLAPASVQRIHAVVRRSCGQAVKWGWLASNPAARATPPRVRQAQRTALVPVEVVVQLIEKATTDDPGFGLLLRMAVATGARRGELVGLRWCAVSFDPPAVDIEAAVVDVAGRLHLKEPKWSSRRRVSIDEETARLLVEHRARCEALAAACETDLRRDGFVWSLDPDGARPIRPEVVTARWGRLARAAGVRCRLHDLRHLSATQLIAGGVDVRTVAERLGHANPSTTLRIYSHAIAARDQAAAAMIGGLLDR